MPKTETASHRQRLLGMLAQLGYQQGEFTLASGERSHYYIDGKQVTLRPEGAQAVGELMLARLPASVQAVAGLTLGADPIVSAVSTVSAYSERPLPALIVRKSAKGHGTRAYLEGPCLPAGTSIAVLEDVVTTGQSVLQAADRLQAAGYSIVQVLALVDREQGAAEQFRARGLPFEALFTLSEVRDRAGSL